MGSDETTEAIIACGCCLGLMTYYVALAAFMAWCIELAWNLFVCDVFRGPCIDYQQAWALYILVWVVVSLLKSLFSGKN